MYMYPLYMPTDISLLYVIIYINCISILVCHMAYRDIIVGMDGDAIASEADLCELYMYIHTKCILIYALILVASLTYKHLYAYIPAYIYS